MSSNLKAVLAQLKSDKIKERQEGISSIRHVFAGNDIIDSLKDWRAWLVVFQALFAAVATERKLCTKTGVLTTHTTGAAANALRRLGEAASAVRWLIERSVTKWTSKVQLDVLSHLIQTLTYQGQLLEPVALDYLKALRCVLSFPPHLEHLAKGTWLKLLELGFNVVLGDPIRKKLDAETDEQAGIDMDSMHSDDEESVMGTPGPSNAGSTRKRPYRERNQTPRSDTDRAVSRSLGSQPVTLVQIECMSVIALLLQSPYTPILSSELEYLPAAILTRLRRFVHSYPTDTSLHHDFLLSLRAILSSLALNKQMLVSAFVKDVWDDLVGLWNTKNQPMKEDLVIVLRIMFQYLLADDSQPGEKADCRTYSDSLLKLWHVLNSDAETRWAIAGLSMDSLRLQVVWSDEDEEADKPFVARSFRYGWRFDSTEALAWAVLELYANCTAELYTCFESVHTLTATREGKRTKIENPVASLLYAIKTQTSTALRSYHLQRLLFFIDSHWCILRDELRQEVYDTLLQFISFEDVHVQSWTFLCLAALAHTEGTSNRHEYSDVDVQHEPRTSMHWENVWPHAMRRITVPLVCRSACHAASVLLFHAKMLLPPPLVHAEIEACARDLAVQGPAFPYDSACTFLKLCLRTAARDVRLYRLEMEEKVLIWLLDNWRPSSEGRFKISPHSSADVLTLLASICSLSKKVNIFCQPHLPNCSVVSAVMEEKENRMIRNFTLQAYLPPFRDSITKGPDNDVLAVDALDMESSSLGTGMSDLADLTARERRISFFLLKSLDDLTLACDMGKSKSGHAAEKLRAFLDLSIIALYFGALLTANHTRADKRVAQSACKLIKLVIPMIVEKHWTTEERVFMLSAFQPLLMIRGKNETASWETILLPAEDSGVRHSILRRRYTHPGDTGMSGLLRSRRELQYVLFGLPEIQDAVPTVTNVLRGCLRSLLGISEPHGMQGERMEVDDNDGFGPVRTTQTTTSLAAYHQALSATDVLGVELCVSFLAALPFLQTASGEATRDKELTEIVLGCDEEHFLFVAEPYFDNIRQQTLLMGISTFEDVLEKLGDLLQIYKISRNDRLQLLVIRFLDSTMHLWLHGDITTGETSYRVQKLCEWLSMNLRQKTIPSWRNRDCLIRFMDRYLSLDPAETEWCRDLPEGRDLRPTKVLPPLVEDEDIRVRLRALISTARMFPFVYRNGEDPVDFYNEVRRYLCKNTELYEEMLTRLLYLGNVMVVSSATRRGAYWHLLETCFYTSTYVKHIGVILQGVSDRLGLSDLSQLFTTYASQMAYSILHADQDFLRLPPLLLGYEDRKACAAATFRAFTPTNVLIDDNDSLRKHGKHVFTNHCMAIQISTADGIRECFADIIGYQILRWIFAHSDATPTFSRELDQILRDKTNEMGEGKFDGLLVCKAESIVVAILRTLGDLDFSSDGELLKCLQAWDEQSAGVFQSLTRHQESNPLHMHYPNVPAFGTDVILRALQCFTQRVPAADSPATTYHALHQLFAELTGSPFINEQLRLVSAICLHVSIRSHHFDDYALLHTLINGAATMMLQADLSRAAQSILEWGLRRYRNEKNKFQYLPDVLIRVACIAHDFSQDNSDAPVAEMGSQLIQWIEGQALDLCKDKTVKAQVVTALAAWPRELSPDLKSLCKNVKSNEFSDVLNNYRISANKFRLITKFRDLTLSDSYNDEQFMSDFWRLKDYIPSPSQIRNDDVDALASVLLLHKGRISHLGTEQQIAQSVRTRHLSNSRRNDPKAGDSLFKAHEPIISSLLAMLRGSSASQVYLAYATLRSLVSVYNYQSQPSLSPDYDELILLNAYPQPISPSPKSMVEDAFAVSEASLDVSRSFSKWITHTTTALCHNLAEADDFFVPILSLLPSVPDFSEQLLPVLIHAVLQADLERNMPEDGCNLRNLLSQYFTSVIKKEYSDKLCLRAVVDIVLHLRHFIPEPHNDPLAYNTWLDIDFVLLSRSALTCGAYTTALLFLELAAEYSGKNDTHEQILFDIYSNLDEPDGFYGIKTHDLRDFLVRRLHHEKQWDKAFRFHGAALASDATNAKAASGMVETLHSFGFDGLAMNMVGVTSATESASTSMAYELGWRAEIWDLPEIFKAHDPGASLYRSLRAFHRERSDEAVERVVWDALRGEIQQLRLLGNESLVQIHQTIRNIMCLYQIKQWRRTEIASSLQQKAGCLVEANGVLGLVSEFDFSDAEAITTTRLSLVRSTRQQEQHGQIGTLMSPFYRALVDLETKFLIDLSATAREADNPQIALNSITKAHALHPDPLPTVSREFANVLWQMNEPKLAFQYLTRPECLPVVGGGNNIVQRLESALLLARMGTWCAEASLDNPGNIVSKYFDPAKELLKDESTPQSMTNEHAQVYHQFAIFAERQYHSLAKSREALRWKVLVDRKKAEVKSLVDQVQRVKQGSKEFIELQQNAHKAKRMLDQDNKKVGEHMRAQTSFLHQAMDMYSRSLEASDSFDDDSITRLCSLWLANFNGLDTRVEFGQVLTRIPSCKFVFLAHQLSARLSTSPAFRSSTSSTSSEKLSQDCLRDLVTRMCREHPFHSLYQVYCLRSERSTSQPSSSRRQSGRHSSPSQQERGAAAREIFDLLRNDPVTQDRVRDVERVCSASLQWAQYPIKGKIDKKQKGALKVPDDLMLRQIRDLRVPVMTVVTEVDKTMKYDNCVWINHWDPTYTTAGGVNLPKINTCIGSDGRRYKQLFKGEGNDDLRQDAVMEQVFDIVNIVLKKDRETRRRKLGVRGYRVIPLAAQAGVLEFVEHTTPLSTWLPPAHRKYRPRDPPYQEVHAQLSRKQKESANDVDAMLQLYTQIREGFKPVMRHYFTEKHKAPMLWFTMRLSYARSVATNSIVGHVLGLGDRHTSNILMDNQTGEVIHIDLGIAFDQGKQLPIPERVPFRLTEDMVDGLGISGTQGVFQRCAEETLRVLRGGSEVILTVLEVFKHDPLHSWTASTDKVQRMQQGGSDEAAQLTTEAFRMAIGIDMASGAADEAADRALSAVSRKLDKTLSVEYTVNELINEATDARNLALMYPGWGPYW